MPSIGETIGISAIDRDRARRWHAKSSPINSLHDIETEPRRREKTWTGSRPRC